MLLYFPGIEILDTEHDLRRERKVQSQCCVYVYFRPPQTSRLGFSYCSRAVTVKGAARAKLLFCLLNLLLFAVIVAKALFVGEGVFHLIEAGYDLLLLTWV